MNVWTILPSGSKTNFITRGQSYKASTYNCNLRVQSRKNEQFSSNYDSRVVVIYERKLFIRLATYHAYYSDLKSDIPCGLGAEVLSFPPTKIAVLAVMESTRESGDLEQNETEFKILTIPGIIFNLVKQSMHFLQQIVKFNLLVYGAGILPSNFLIKSFLP